MDTPRTVLALWIIWLIFWMVSSIGTKRTVRRDGSWRISLLLAAIALWAAARVFGESIRHRLLAAAPWIAPTSLALCAIGLAFSIWARVILGRNWSASPSIKEGHELIQAGPYRFVRHPIYTGLLLAFFGTFLGRARIIDLLIFAALCATTIIKMGTEEKLMLQQFPEIYPEYQKRTKALIPFIF